jgi:tetratricopeptide (TPR) repeat protein
VALFGKKGNNNDDESGDSGAPVPESFSPKKAKAFFDHAKTAHESGNYEYAMINWLKGLGKDPTSMFGLNAFLKSSEVFALENPKKKSKDTKSAISEIKGDVGKYVNALLDFGLKRLDCSNAIKVSSAAAKINLKEPVLMLGEHALKLVLNDPKPKKDMFVKLLDAFEAVQAYDLAAVAGEQACRLDQSDGELQARLRNMLAKSTMTSGGYDNDEEGGFRKNIRDADKQLELEQHDSLAKTDSTKDQIVIRCAEEHTARPDDLPTLEKYAKALLSRAKGSDELKALTLFSKAYKESGAFRFRQEAGEIQVMRAKRTLAKIEAMAKGDPSNEEAVTKLAKARTQFDKLQLDELTLQVENYPTDLGLKYRLGKILFDRGAYQESIEQFQLAQNDPKIRRHVLNLMGQAFLNLGGWEDAAITTFEQAFDGITDESSELGMDIRYGLMEALQAKAKKDADIESAERADKLAAGLAIQQFNYRDVRERRDQIKALIDEIKV